MKCKICEKEIIIKGFGAHIKFHKMSIKEYYDKYLKKENEGICVECGKKTKFYGIGKAYSKYCSVKCMRNSKEIKEKQKQTCLERYGVENPFQNEEIKEKIKQTNIEKYGVENPAQSKEIQKKSKHTNLIRYGIEYGFLDNKKVKNTNIKKYNVEYPSQNEEIQEKIKQTNIERYGVEYPLQNKELYKKQKQTCLDHYNVEHPLQSKEIHDKFKQTNMKRYGVEYSQQSDEYKEKQKQETIKKYRNEFLNLNIIDYDISNSIMSCYCNECNKTYNINLMLLNDRLRYKKFNNPCTNCFPVDRHYSNKEKELLDFIKSIYNGKVIENDRSILKRQELDIYLPEKKIAFEFNGLYWHSEIYKERNYHLDKTIECEKQGIQLVHIFENEWMENNEKIKRYIKELINNNINIEEYDLIFKRKENKIIVNRQFNNGKILEKYGYRLINEINSQLQEIQNKNITYKVYNCGYLEYIKE